MMWELYDRLIEPIADDEIVTDIIAGPVWTAVMTKNLTGVAATGTEPSLPRTYSGTLIGKNLKDVAKLSKSWNFIEASIGVAAINAYYNNAERIEECAGAVSDLELGDDNAFGSYKDELKGKTVSTIGHFGPLDKYLLEAGKLHILERKPLWGDYPDSACEYLLPESDYVFITGSALVNKTLPRLLELSKNARVIILGPSTVMTSVMFEFGAHDLSGFAVSDSLMCRRFVAEGSHKELFTTGRRMRLRRMEKDKDETV